jgi:hypothetical protein
MVGVTGTGKSKKKPDKKEEAPQAIGRAQLYVPSSKDKLTGSIQYQQ